MQLFNGSRFNNYREGAEGIGPITRAEMTISYRRGCYKDIDTFFSFSRIYILLRHSLKRKRQRRLSQQGDPKLRGLLYQAVMQAKRHAGWQGSHKATSRPTLKRSKRRQPWRKSWPGSSSHCFGTRATMTCKDDCSHRC